MRLLLGIFIGILLTIGGAYIYDSQTATTTTAAEATAPANAQRPLVNWDVASVKWHEVTRRAQSEWRRLAAR
jgi:hypothetical protein